MFGTIFGWFQAPWAESLAWEITGFDHFGGHFFGEDAAASGRCSFIVLIFFSMAQEKWDLMGGNEEEITPPYLGDHEGVTPNCCWPLDNSPTKSCLAMGSVTKYAQTFPKISIASHEFPCHPFCIERRDGQKTRGAAQDPEQRRKRQAHTGNRFRLTRLERSGAQASRHLPQVASA